MYSLNKTGKIGFGTIFILLNIVFMFYFTARLHESAKKAVAFQAAYDAWAEANPEEAKRMQEMKAKGLDPFAPQQKKVTVVNIEDEYVAPAQSTIGYVVNPYDERQ